MLGLGSFPAISIADARRERAEAHRLLEGGTDPAVQRKHDRIAAESAARTTFGLVAEQYLSNREQNSAAASTSRRPIAFDSCHNRFEAGVAK